MAKANGGEVPAALILSCLLILPSASAFYLPGVAPRDFQKVIPFDLWSSCRSGLGLRSLGGCSRDLSLLCFLYSYSWIWASLLRSAWNWPREWNFIAWWRCGWVIWSLEFSQIKSLIMVITGSRCLLLFDILRLPRGFIQQRRLGTTCYIPSVPVLLLNVALEG